MKKIIKDDEESKIAKIEHIATIYNLTTQDGNIMPSAQMAGVVPTAFNALFVAGACVMLYESFLNMIKEQEQNTFEAQFKKVFLTMFDNRHNYTEIITKNL